MTGLCLSVNDDKSISIVLKLNHSTKTMRSAMMFIFCGLSLVFLTFVPPTAADADIPIDTSAPLSILHGEYHIEDANQMSYRPTWASVWRILEEDIYNGAFYFSFWPPKYCHAIYLCPVKEATYNQNEKFKTEQGTCENEYIKYYPHIKKLLLKADGKPEEEKSLMSNRFMFSGDRKNANLEILDNTPDSFSSWKEEMKKKTKFTFNFEKKDLLVLTNSRMCQVNKPGAQFYPFFRHAAQKSTDYPEWFHTGKETIRTESLPPITKSASGKTIDLLDYIKKLEWSSGKVGMLNKECTSMGRSAERGHSENPNSLFRRISIQSYEVNVHNSLYQGAKLKEFGLSTPSCHWFRIWVTDMTVEAKDYKDKLDLKDTIDIFLNEGFYVTPDSNIAYPLPSVIELQSWRFRSLSVDNLQSPLIEMSFAFGNRNYIHYAYFEMPKMIANKFKMHIIKAPGCHLDLEKQAAQTFTDYPTEIPTHMWSVDKCRYSFFKDPSK